MSKIYVCEYTKDSIECKRVFQEESDGEANRFAQRRAGGMRAELKTETIRDGAKLYQIILFKTDENSGYFCLSNNKMLSLKKSDILESIKQTLPEEVKNTISKLTGVNMDKNDSENNDQILSDENNDNKKNESLTRLIKSILLK